MTPSEKAKELVDKFYVHASGHDHTQLRSAKECAKICVEEIRNEDYPGYPTQREYYEWSDYWIAVNQEIDKIE